jgi:hypothetical protein
MAACTLVVLACGQDRRAPGTTPGDVGTNTPPTPGGTTSSTGGEGGGGSSATGGGAGGQGGAGGGIPNGLAQLLTCVDQETHNQDCEVCRASQMQSACTAQWFACSDDAYCELPFFDCAASCAAGDFACENDCYQAKPASQPVISDFALCACYQCVGICS